MPICNMYNGIRSMEVTPAKPLINACNEWDPLKEVIVGVAEYSMFPWEDKRFISGIFPEQYVQEFYPNHPFPHHLVREACEELENFVKVLQKWGVTVVRAEKIDWSKTSPTGYSAAFPRDALFVAGNCIIEAPMAFKCRNNEHLAYEKIFERYSANNPKSHSQVIRRPILPDNDNLLDGGLKAYPFVINNSRPAFDAADFVRIGNNTILGQLSHVTNFAGVELLRKQLKRFKIEVVVIEGIEDPHAMHIDATLLPLRQNLMLYNPTHLTAEILCKLPALRGWKFIAAPTPKNKRHTPLFLSSGWLNMNVLVLDPTHVFVEADDDDMCALLESHGFQTIRVPFQHVQSLGGSFHCSTLDVRREAAAIALGDRPLLDELPPMPLPIAGPQFCLGHILKNLDTLICGLGSALSKHVGYNQIREEGSETREVVQVDKKTPILW